MVKKRSVIFLMTVWVSLVQAKAWPRGTHERTDEKTSTMLSNRKEKAKEMTNQEAWKLYERYLEGWKAISPEQRAAIAAEVVTQDVQYSTPTHELGGRETMIEDMAAFQKRVPGGRFDLGDVSAHHNVALLTWVLVLPDGNVAAKGHDQIRVSSEGKIASLVTFAPSVSKP